MARKRMFRLDVLDTDAFLDMPLSTQALYFHLCLRADDDGFVGNPKRIAVVVGASLDDLKLLIAKRFVLAFEDGVIVIKHWRMHNTIQKDRYTPTKYQDDLNLLKLNGNSSYSLSDHGIVPNEIEAKSDGKKKGLSSARHLRLQAKKESSLPYDFENSIRIAFNGERCPICGCVMTIGDNQCMPTVQHNKPISLGGKHEISNISVICRSCNSSIQNKVETEPYNTDKVIEKWNAILGMDRECVGNVSADIDIDLDIDKGTDKDLEVGIYNNIRSSQNKDFKEGNTYSSCSEPFCENSELEADVELIPLNDGSGWRPSISLYEEYCKLYPNVDINAAFKRIRAWCISNPTKCKTRRGVKRFINSWLSREQDAGGRRKKSLADINWDEV